MTSRRWLVALLLIACSLPTSAAAQDGAQVERIKRVEATTFPVGWPGSETEERLTPKQWMELLKVPGVSIAVIDNYKVVWAKGYGLADVEKKQPVTPTTLFQAGSISKPVAAAGVLTLFDAGRFSLDRDVNEYLKSWKIPGNEFTKDEKVTLRRLLSHTAGTTVNGFPGYAVGDPRPTLAQILNGEKPANTTPVRVDIVPGSEQRYSGGGTTVAQLAVIDTTGKPFPDFMRDAVLKKAGMTHSTYQQPLPGMLAARTATGYRSDGKIVEGRWHIYPEMAAAGLWTTPTDLANFAIEIMRAKQGKSKMLSQQSAELMLKPVKEDAALGFFVEKSGQFGHNGSDEGFQAMLVAFPVGKGVALMSNSDNGTRAMYRFLWAIAKEYGMNVEQPMRSFSGTMYYLTLRKGAKAAIAEARERLKAGKPPFEVKDGDLNNAAIGLVFGDKRGEDALALLDYNLELHPQSSAVYQIRAVVNREFGRKEDAMRDARRAVELDAKSDEAQKLIKELEGK